MLQGTPGRVREYYDEHPISEAHVLAAVAGQGLTGPVTADDLFEFDQDHYGGLAFPSLADRERQRLWEWMAATTLQTLDSYRGLLGRSGFTNVEAEDLSSEWR